MADVLLATTAVAVLARSRHQGGLAVAPCVSMTLGAIVLAVSDLMSRAAALETRCEGMLALALMLWAAGAWLPGDGAESDPETHWRERVAVLAPLPHGSPKTIAEGIDHRPVRVADRDGLHLRSGLPVLPADAAGGHRRAARGAVPRPDPRLTGQPVHRRVRRLTAGGTSLDR